MLSNFSNELTFIGVTPLRVTRTFRLAWESKRFFPSLFKRLATIRLLNVQRPQRPFKSGRAKKFDQFKQRLGPGRSFCICTPSRATALTSPLLPRLRGPCHKSRWISDLLQSLHAAEELRSGFSRWHWWDAVYPLWIFHGYYNANLCQNLNPNHERCGNLDSNFMHFMHRMIFVCTLFLWWFTLFIFSFL